LMLKHGEPNYSLLGYDTVVWAAQYVILKCWQVCCRKASPLLKSSSLNVVCKFVECSPTILLGPYHRAAIPQLHFFKNTYPDKFLDKSLLQLLE
jgi:hypothetical protein